jgi:hypothetical protein
MKRFFACSVGCRHAIEVERFESEDGTEWDDSANAPIDVGVWQDPYREGLWRRLKDAWTLVRGRKVLMEGLCLTHADAQELGRFLIAISTAMHPADARRTTATGSGASFFCLCGGKSAARAAQPRAPLADKTLHTWGSGV